MGVNQLLNGVSDEWLINITQVNIVSAMEEGGVIENVWGTTII